MFLHAGVYCIQSDIIVYVQIVGNQTQPGYLINFYYIRYIRFGRAKNIIIFIRIMITFTNTPRGFQVYLHYYMLSPKIP